MVWRYLAQDVLTGAWLDTDLPLIRDAEQPKWEMSGAGSLTGRISGDHPSLRDGNGYTILREWGTWLYAELDRRIVWAGIIQRSDFNGADWTVQAFGATSYLAGLPYTGSYQKFIATDPGVIVNALWQHAQSQPDGNLGVRIVMPPDMGPDAGTKDEPYELSWWEAKDCGSEVQQFATDGPFDYVESHAYTHAVDVSQASFWVAGGNLQGGYDGTDKGWMKGRAKGQADLIGSMGVGLFAAEELHEETSSAMPAGAHRWFEGVMRQRVGPQWSLYEGNGGNQLLYDTTQFAVLGVTTRDGVDDPNPGLSGNLRSASMFTVQHLASGLVFSAAVYHLHGDDTDGTNRDKTRISEAQDMPNLVGGATGPLIVFGDFNEWSEADNQVFGIVRASLGLETLQRRTDPDNADLNSLNAKHQSRWLDEILTRPTEWDVSDAAGVPTRKLSDHHLWIRTRVTARSGTAALAPQVSHTVTFSYPRAGRRRLDLKFVQGDNIIETVAPVRDGSMFANTVITLGKGEGAKTLRGEDTVRDGRLRRPAIYTDKLAATTKRCQALSKRERGWRNLAGTVESILVADHPNAPLGSWALGDDILVEAYDVPHLGKVVDWHRIVAWSLVSDTTARLTLTRSDAFTYGPTVSPPSDDDTTTPDREGGIR